MRPEWRDAIATQYLWDDYGQSRWRSSAALEEFITYLVGEASFRYGYRTWGPGAGYDDARWSESSYPHWYLAQYVPLYVASLHRAILRLAPVRGEGPLRVLDVGVGVGTTALALADLLNTAELLALGPHVGVQLMCLDYDKAKIGLARGYLLEFAGGLCRSTREQALSWAVDPHFWVPCDLAQLDDATLCDQQYDLIVLGNVVRELERAAESSGDVSARLALVERLVPRHLAPGGVVLMLEPGREGGEEFCRTACDLRAELVDRGLVLIAPFVGPCGCERVVVDDCACTQAFPFEWPDYYTEWTDGQQPPHRVVRSVWVALRKPTVQEDDDSWQQDVAGQLVSRTQLALPGIPFSCPVCGAATRHCSRSDAVGFLGCDDYCEGRGSVTEFDGTVRMPSGRNDWTRVNKLALGAAAAATNEAARPIQSAHAEAQRARAALRDFRFQAGRVYRNSLFEYQVVDVGVGAGRILVRRCDTGEQMTLLARIAAIRFLELEGSL